MKRMTAKQRTHHMRRARHELRKTKSGYKSKAQRKLAGRRKAARLQRKAQLQLAAEQFEKNKLREDNRTGASPADGNRPPKPKPHEHPIVQEVKKSGWLNTLIDPILGRRGQDR